MLFAKNLIRVIIDDSLEMSNILIPFITLQVLKIHFSRMAALQCPMVELNLRRMLYRRSYPRLEWRYPQRQKKHRNK